MALPLLALTMGEPAGIGGEIAIKAWRTLREDPSAPVFFLIDDPERLARIDPSAGIEEIEHPEAARERFSRALPVLRQALDVEARPGEADPANAAAVIAAIERAVKLVGEGQADALVTNPIHKQTLYQAGFKFPGHTEYLAHLAGGGAQPAMLLLCPGLKVVPVTVHLPLKDVVGALTAEAIVQAGQTLAAALQRDFGIAAPRLAVAALNPHAGESGALGREEIEVIAPAVEVLRGEGISISGPAPADTLFHAEARPRYDAALCMYHDQALLPLKTIDFHSGVNVTLGLPFIRTSPDHGTAFDIAGQGKADARSLIAAIRTAGEMADRRRAADG